MIDGLNAEETYRIEKQLRRDECMMVDGEIIGKVEQNAVKGSADRIMNAIIYGK